MRNMILLLLVLVSAAPGLAQIVSGSIVGSTKDSSGAVIARVKVTLVNTDTNQVRETATNDSGSRGRRCRRVRDLEVMRDR